MTELHSTDALSLWVYGTVLKGTSVGLLKCPSLLQAAHYTLFWSTTETGTSNQLSQGQTELLHYPKASTLHPSIHLSIHFGLNFSK